MPESILMHLAMGVFNFRVVIHTAPEVEEITSMSVFTNQQVREGNFGYLVQTW